MSKETTDHHEGETCLDPELVSQAHQDLGGTVEPAASLLTEGTKQRKFAPIYINELKGQ